jgi:hypothetical protein
MYGFVEVTSRPGILHSAITSGSTPPLASIGNGQKESEFDLTVFLFIVAKLYTP